MNTAADTIAADLARFIAPDQFTEIRALHVGQRGRTFAGWFDGRHLRDLARNALALSRQAAGVYFVPNPVEPSVAEWRLNQVLDVHRGFALTHDDDIIERRFLIIDLDPHRSRFDPETGDYLPSQECPTSARELAFARQIATRHVQPFLMNLGFNPPVVMLSGNGIHLVYQTAATPSRECGSADPLATVLRLLRDRFQCWTVSIDTNTFNPSRMLKVPGTCVRKGEASASRPHRMARILEVPNGWLEPQQPPAGVSDKTADQRPVAGTAERREDTRSDPARMERSAKRNGRKSRAPARLFDAGSGADRPPVH